MPQARRSSPIPQKVSYAGLDAIYFLRKYWDALSLPGAWGSLLSLLVAAGVVIWMAGLQVSLRAGDPRKLGNVDTSDLWFSPKGALLGYQVLASGVRVVEWDPASLRISNDWQFNSPLLFKHEAAGDPSKGTAAQDTQAGLSARQSPINQSNRQIYPRRVPNPSSENRAEAIAANSSLLQVAVSPSGSRVATAFGTDVLVATQNGAEQKLDSFPAPAMVTGLALTDSLLGRQLADYSVELIDLTTKKTLARQSHRGLCVFRATGDYMAQLCPEEGELTITDPASTRHFVRGERVTSGGVLLLPIISRRGYPAVTTAGGTVLIPGEGKGSATLSREFTAPGLVQTGAFFGDERLLLAGAFPGVYAIGAGIGREQILGDIKAIALLAAEPPYVAYSAAGGPVVLKLNPYRKLNSTGWASLMTLASLLGLYFATGLVRLYTRETEIAQEVRLRTVLGYEAQAAPSPETVLPLPELPAALVEACASRTCVAYVGAGLSARAGLPTWGPFVHSLLGHMRESGLINPSLADGLREALQQGQADLVADSLVSLAQDRQLIYDFLRKTFLTDVRLPVEYQTLAEVPFSAVLTTNFDELLERTFGALRAPVYTHRDSPRLLEALSKREFFVLKLYGTLAQPDTVLVAPAQYQEAIAKNSLFAQFMGSLFASQTMFFVGCSLEGIEAYLTGISFQGATPRPHYALVNVVGTAWRAKADLLARRYGIQVIPYTARSDFGDLRRFLRSLADAVAVRMPEVQKAPATARLKAVTLENVGPFERLRLQFDQHWTVLLGDNGVGKSTILKAIAAAICGKDSEKYARRLVKSKETSASITLETDAGQQYVTKLLVTTVGAEVTTLPVRPLETEGWLGLGFPPLRSFTWVRSREMTSSGIPRSTSADLLPLVNGEIDPRLDNLKNWIVDLDYKIKSELVQRGSRVKGGKTRYEQLRDDFFYVIGELTPGLKINYFAVNPETKEVTVETEDGLVPIEGVSQGTASLLGWIGILMERMYDVFGETGADYGPGSAAGPRNQYALVLIDEIDAHMHPKWQQLVVGTLKKLFPNVQFVATTHSPLIVVGLNKNEVLLVRRGEDGRVKVESPALELKGWRADQVLTGPLFNLPSSIDPELHEAMKRYSDLAARSDLSLSQRQELENLAASLNVQLPTPKEREEARVAFELLEGALDEKLNAMPEEKRKRILQEAKVQVQETITGSRRTT